MEGARGRGAVLAAEPKRERSCGTLLLGEGVINRGFFVLEQNATVDMKGVK